MRVTLVISMAIQKLAGHFMVLTAAVAGLLIHPIVN